MITYYLLCHGYTEETGTVDPFTAPLAPRGIEQAQALADVCQGWDIQFLCASTAVRAEQTADIIQLKMPEVVRWDLKELETLSVDDMEGQVIFSPHVRHWSPQQYRYGLERTWVRLVAALARIEIYAEARGLQRIALVTHADIINQCLYDWLGLDWTAHERLRFSVDTGASCQIVMDAGHTQLGWVNRSG